MLITTTENFEAHVQALPVIGFDFEALISFALGIRDKYAGIAVREEDVKDIKKLVADLNKTKAGIETARKEAVKRVSAPIREFEAKIKEAVTIITDTRAALDDQVKAYEERERERKRREVEFLITDLKDEHGVQDMDIQIHPQWLNKTTTMKAIKAEVESCILANLKAEREARELEQARRDRAAFIERTCSDMARKYGLSLPPSRFLRLNDLEIPLEEVARQIENAHTMRAAAIQAESLRDPEPTSDPAPVRTEPVQAAPAPQTETMHAVTVEITYTDAQAQDVESVLRDLQAVAASVRIVNPGRMAA